MEILGKLFGSASRVKLMRLFLLSPEEVFSGEDIRKKTRVTQATFRKEINLLQKTEFLEKKPFPEDPEKKKEKGSAAKKTRRKEGYALNPDFPFIEQFRSILISTETLEKDSLLKRVENAGRVKVMIVAGIFIGEENSRVDMLIVGDKLKSRALEATMRALESEVGRALNYSVLSSDEYAYRMEVHDKLVRDILDYPHEKLVDRLTAL